ncbi:MAG: HD domain-containing protein [Deltaproteobacteria bacterium]|nr:HD domain-containing protein [Deltaproteobacteria bacterium]
MADINNQQEIGRIISRLTVAIQNASMYPDDHPQVIHHAQEAFALLNLLLKDAREITILLIGEYVSVGNKPLLIPDFYEAAFVSLMKKNGVEWISFLSGLPFAQLEELILSFASSGSSFMNSTRYIKLGKIKLKESDKIGTAEKYDLEASDKDIENVMDLRFLSKEQMIQKIYQSCRDKNKIDLNMVDQIVADFMVIIRESNPLKLLAEIKSNNEYTFTHSSNVGILAMSLAERLGFNGHYLNEIGIAALLHDVGKATTPDDILSKEGPLTKKERIAMEEHVIKGAIQLMKLKGVNKLAILAAMEHHIKYDGSGYPRIKGGWEPNIVSQIIAVADVYDALRSMRPYREAMSQDQIIRIMTDESGTTFNPYLIECFLKLIQQ